MPVQRGKAHHRDRIAETLREEIGAMIEGELSDPRIAFCYISEVLIAPGGKSARIYVAVDGGEKEETETMEALVTARADIRAQLLQRTGKRHIPDLTFHIDRSEKIQGRIDELLGRVKKRHKPAKAPADPAPAPAIKEDPKE
jgi:ribosome-binding factor A